MDGKEEAGNKETHTEVAKKQINPFAVTDAIWRPSDLLLQKNSPKIQFSELVQSTVT